MSGSPKVSIILPTYNGSKYIRKSIDSCLEQTFKDFELIIVDDCSTDETPAIVKSYTDPRIRYHRNPTNQRLPRSLNIGFSLARGKYLTWTSDDNFYMPEAIERMVKCLEENKGEYVYADIFAFQEENIKGAKHDQLPDCEMMNVCNCVRACFLYTRKAKDAVGEYDPDMELIEDYDYWVRIWQKFNLYHIKEPLYYYRYHSKALWSINFMESPIREYLFKWKYGFMTEDLINWNLRDLKRKTLHGFAKYQRMIMDRLINKRKISQVLRGYKAGKYTFVQARNILNTIINGTVKRP